MKSSPSPVSLKVGIAEVFDDVALDAAQLSALHALDATRQTPAAAEALPPASTPSMPARRRWLAMAASLAAVGALGVWMGRRPGSASLAELLADEVAYNHIVHSVPGADQLDIEASTLDALRPTFANIGFALVDPQDDPALADARLLGGRFCRVMAAAAVQLRYRGARGDLSVCQARFDPERHGELPDLVIASETLIVTTRGLRVSLGQRAGVLVAVVG